MARDGWQEAREAWERLVGKRHVRGGKPLDVLSDIGVVRRMLDQAELEAVRAARGARSSWAEIATRLGVTRQSAWERWRDLDEEPAAEGSGPAVTVEVVPTPLWVTVPNVVDMSWPVARHRLDEERLRGVSADDAHQPFLGPEAADFAVVEQKPAAGERVVAGSDVVLWLHRGPGSAGDRAPLPPPPPPRARRGAIDEVTGESVR